MKKPPGRESAGWLEERCVLSWWLLADRDIYVGTESRDKRRLAGEGDGS